MSDEETTTTEPQAQAFMSNTIGKIAGALAKAQGAMGGAVKDSQNPHLKNKYADLASVMDAIKKPLSDSDIAITQLVENAGDKFAIRTLLAHSSGEWFMSYVILPATANKGVNEAQAMGSTISYLRRYSASAITGLHQEDDDAASAKDAKPKAAEPAKKAEPAKTYLTAIQLIEKLDKIDNFPQLKNTWNAYAADMEKMNDTDQQKCAAAKNAKKDALEAAKSDKVEPDPVEQDAERGDGAEPEQKDIDGIPHETTTMEPY